MDWSLGHSNAKFVGHGRIQKNIFLSLILQNILWNCSKMNDKFRITKIIGSIRSKIYFQIHIECLSDGRRIIIIRQHRPAIGIIPDAVADSYCRHVQLWFRFNEQIKKINAWWYLHSNSDVAILYYSCNNPL
jgi:hypothetical protein